MCACDFIIAVYRLAGLLCRAASRSKTFPSKKTDTTSTTVTYKEPSDSLVVFGSSAQALRL